MLKLYFTTLSSLVLMHIIFLKIQSIISWESSLNVTLGPFLAPRVYDRQTSV